jgi:hypothetical protein
MEMKIRRPRALRRSLTLAGALALGLVGPVACGPVDPMEQESDLTGRTGLELTLQLDEYSDVAAIGFKIDRQSCAGEEFTPYSLELKRDLEEIRLPGGIPGFEDNPFDEDSSHAFADLFVDLPEGCYNITTMPLAADGGPSQDCSPASTWNVQIVDGQTTEILLINQCWPKEGRGAIDVIAGLNHPPELVAVAFERSKFVYQCTDQVVCATAKDVDWDPIEFTWTNAGGPAPLYAGPEVVSTTTNDDGSVTQCVRMVAGTPGGYDTELVVYDLMHDTANGGYMRIQDYLFQGGNLYPSNDKLTFPFYAASDGRTGGCDGGGPNFDDGSGANQVDRSEP